MGVAIASWVNYQSNYIPHDGIELVGSPPYHIKTPDLEWVKMALLRMVIGYSSLFLTRAVSIAHLAVYPFSYSTSWVCVRVEGLICFFPVSLSNISVRNELVQCT